MRRYKTKGWHERPEITQLSLLTWQIYDMRPKMTQLSLLPYRFSEYKRKRLWSYSAVSISRICCSKKGKLINLKVKWGLGYNDLTFFPFILDLWCTGKQPGSHSSRLPLEKWRKNLRYDTGRGRRDASITITENGTGFTKITSHRQIILQIHRSQSFLFGHHRQDLCHKSQTYFQPFSQITDF